MTEDEIYKTASQLQADLISKCLIGRDKEFSVIVHNEFDFLFALTDLAKSIFFDIECDNTFMCVEWVPSINNYFITVNGQTENIHEIKTYEEVLDFVKKNT